MKTQKIIYLLFAGLLILVIYIAKDTFSQPTLNDLEGNFTELASYRNENNTGPIIRLYVVSISDTLWNEMETYGDMMPHSKYGNTKIYFFPEGEDVPSDITPVKPYFSTVYQSSCLALYEKTSMGDVRFTKFPFTVDQ
ncbi:hypothetical protein [Anditalea andensis]|uniref:Uncharacterized protein n=1 Tax=Anditalea andensis TaxID=1048983 RepID=A0A074LLR3_9BACT|nr:hypothetical protein [Anditalea andensis]KEO74807.1 hypothetical protein EL17_03775 [Anditalea andensis]